MANRAECSRTFSRLLEWAAGHEAFVLASTELETFGLYVFLFGLRAVSRLTEKAQQDGRTTGGTLRGRKSHYDCVLDAPELRIPE